MADAIIKRWNGSAWVEDYPKTTHTQIVASGTPDSTTFLRGDGTWATPTGGSGLDADTVDGQHASAFANASHTHGNISNTGTATNTDFSPGSGVKLMVSDSTNTIGKSSVAFLGGGTGFLRQDGSWATPTDTNNFPSSLSFSSGTLTLARNGLSSLTASIDGRYLPLSGGTLTGAFTVSGANSLFSAGDANFALGPVSGVNRIQSYASGTNIGFLNSSDGWASIAVGNVLINNSTAVWHSGNDGANSGLDADLLDGNHASAFASASHSHSTSDITSGTLSVARGGTGTASYTSSGGVMYYNSQSGIISVGGAASQNAFLQATGYNGTHYFGNWVTPATAALAIGPELYATTTITSLAANTLSSSYSVTGYRFATVQLSNTAANTTTTIATIRIDLTDTNQRGTTTGNQRYHRFVWNNGTSTFADNLEIYSASSTTIQFRHNAGITCRYRITWEE